MTENAKRSLSLLAVSTVIGVAAGFLVAPQSGRESRSSMKRGIEKAYRVMSSIRKAPAATASNDSLARYVETPGPYPHS